jgi:hypothetical protein
MNDVISNNENKQSPQARGKKRSMEIAVKVRSTMNRIVDEIRSNEGVYPFNKGSLSSAELCRRANIHPTTLFTPKQRELGREVNAWLEQVKTGNTVGRAAVRRSLGERIEDWRQLYNALAQAHRDTELELQQLEFEKNHLLNDLTDLQLKNRCLEDRLNELMGSNVVPLKGAGASASPPSETR